MIQCQICQHENPQGAEYCEDCGASLATATAPPAAPAPTSPETPAPAAEATSDSATTPATPVDDELPAAAAAPSSPADSTDVDAPAMPQTAPLNAGTELEGIDASAEGTVPASSDAASPLPADAAGAAVPASLTGANPRLTAMRFGAVTGEAYPLSGARLTVGRFDAETGPVDIDLSQAPEAAQISRNHAEVYREGDVWMVRDLGSTNGVFVRAGGAGTFGPRITEPRQLAHGDEVSFGNARFVFQTD